MERRGGSQRPGMVVDSQNLEQITSVTVSDYFANHWWVGKSDVSICGSPSAVLGFGLFS